MGFNYERKEFPLVDKKNCMALAVELDGVLVAPTDTFSDQLGLFRLDEGLPFLPSATTWHRSNGGVIGCYEPNVASDATNEDATATREDATYRVFFYEIPEKLRRLLDNCSTISTYALYTSEPKSSNNEVV